MFQKILVCTDFSKDSRSAMAVALDLAKRSKAALYCLHVLPKMEGRVRTVMLKSAQKDMARYLPARVYPGSRTEIQFQDSKSKAIVEYAVRHGVDIIVLGTKGRTALGDLLMGSVTQQVIRISHIPVLVVPTGSRLPSRRKKQIRILCPTDFSPVSRKALNFAVRMAKSGKGRIQLLHVLDSRVLLYSLWSTSLSRTVDMASKRAVNKLFLKLAGAEKDTISDVSTTTGDPPKKIIQYAKDHQVDFIVMGAHGQKGLDRIILGSVTATVLSRAKVPVITISARYRPSKNAR